MCVDRTRYHFIPTCGLLLFLVRLFTRARTSSGKQVSYTIEIRDGKISKETVTLHTLRSPTVRKLISDFRDIHWKEMDLKALITKPLPSRRLWDKDRTNSWIRGKT